MAKITLKLPKLAVSMREGTIVSWNVEDGERIAVGQVIYIVETDKTSTEIESPFEGVITRLVTAGEIVDVGAPIAEIRN